MASHDWRVITKAVIPAAGLGTRLLPATKSQPKEMLPVGRKPAIQYIVEELAQAGFRNVLLISGQKKRAIEDHFDFEPGGGNAGGNDLANGGYWPVGMRFFYVRQSVPLGLADAVGAAQPLVGEEPFAVALGDSIIRGEGGDSLIERMIAVHREQRPAAVIAVEEVAPADTVKYGIVAPKGEPGAAFEIGDLVEKPSPEEAPSLLAVAARYIFEPVIFDAISEVQPGAGGELQLTDAIRLLLRNGERVYGVRLGPWQRRYDIGTFDSYFEAFFDFCLADEELGEEFRAYALRTLGVADAVGGRGRA